jgi:SAM-dependent methyltransferase
VLGESIPPDVREEGLRLGPWHLNVKIAPGLTTRDFYEAGPPPTNSFYDPALRIKPLLRSIYPGGIEGKTVLDCACNNGAFLFAAREMGAGRCLGIDVRDHWIEQTRFLARHRGDESDELTFRVLDLYELPTLGLEPFDITIFSGIFYHLPEPIRGLQIAADLTRELIFVSSMARSGQPDGLLAFHEESMKDPLMGVYGLNWLPTGPNVIRRMLEHMGFAETRCCKWRMSKDPGTDHVQVVAGRTPGSLAHFDTDHRSLLHRVEQNVRPRATILVTTAGQDRLLSIDSRQVWQFPRVVNGNYDPSLDGKAGALADHLEQLRLAGAGHLIVPRFAFPWLEQNAEFRDFLTRNFEAVGGEAERGLLYDLNSRLRRTPKVM